VNPLGEIDDFEVARERADQRLGIACGQVLDQRVQLVVGRRNGGPSRALDQLEESVAALLAQDVPDERAEYTDIVPQRRVLRCKFDFAR